MTESNPPSPTESPRPLQFSLRTLLLAPLVVAAFCAVWTALPGVLAFLVTVVCVMGPGLWYRPTRTAASLLGIAAMGLMCLLPGISSAPRAARRAQCCNNLKQIALAMHNYHDLHGCFPPAYVADAKGQPMHSWRVLILPLLEEKPLYDKYDFNEPWNGPNNSKLANEIIQVYSCPSDTSRGARPTDTNYVVVVGPETMWPGAQCVKLADVGDGTSNTILVVEVANSGIHWMEPRDLHLGQMAPTINPKAGQGISSEHAGGADFALADGSVHFLPEDMPAEKLRALLTRAGGEPVVPDDL